MFNFFFLFFHPSLLFYFLCLALFRLLTISSVPANPCLRYMNANGATNDIVVTMGVVSSAVYIRYVVSLSRRTPSRRPLSLFFLVVLSCFVLFSLLLFTFFFFFSIPFSLSSLFFTLFFLQCTRIICERMVRCQDRRVWTYWTKSVPRLRTVFDPIKFPPHPDTGGAPRPATQGTWR